MSLLDQDLQNLNAGSNYKFSATKFDKLGAAAYTLVTIVIDASSSVVSFATDLEKALKTVYKACDKSPRRDFLMLRVVQFNDTLSEIHGFKLFGSIKEDDYTGCLKIGGMTALFDATDEAITVTSTYGATLQAKDYDANGLVVVITDGENNKGTIRQASLIAKSISDARKAENLQSILVILVGVTNDDNNLNGYLQGFRDEGTLDQYVSIGTATPGKVAKLAQFVSHSISSTSASLAGGVPSHPLDPNAFAI
jgi:hypothetical protein